MHFTSLHSRQNIDVDLPNKSFVQQLGRKVFCKQVTCILAQLLFDFCNGKIADAAFAAVVDIIPDG